MTFVPPGGATLLQLVGAGTFVEVALVRHGDRDLLCKRLRPRMANEAAARDALGREAAVLELVRHPALPELVSRGEDDWGPYVLLSCLRGASLRELVDGWRERGSKMPAPLVAHVLERAFDALAQLHELRDDAGPLELSHGDIAPENVLLGERGEVFFIDFGQARWRGMPFIPGSGERGTLPFVAPELARAEREPDQSSDVYALAATMAFVALGREPCGADSPAARLVEVSEQGLDLEAIAGSEGLTGAQRRALQAALCFERAGRLLEAAAVVAALRTGG